MGNLFKELAAAKRDAHKAGKPTDYKSVKGGILSNEVARERLKRAMMAARQRSKYKFRDPNAIYQKYGSPSRLDRGQSTAAAQRPAAFTGGKR